MNELFEKYSARGLQIISVTKEKPEVVKPFVAEQGVKYTIGLDSGATVKAYGIRSIPTAYLIGTDGKVIWEGHPRQLEDSVIEKALQAVEKK
jgi:peroxiredoxin